MLGLAIGDAVGSTLEFLPRDDDAPRLTDMIGGGPFLLKPGQWTDDTSMALALAYSLQDHPELDEADLLRRFVDWWKKGYYSCTGTCFDIGNTTRQALQHFLNTGETQSGPSGEYDAGNGSLMRLAPVAIRYWNDPEKRRNIAARQSRTTHGASEAVDACILFADILADAIAGKPRSQVLRPRQGSYTGKIHGIADGSWRGKPRTEIRGSGYVVHCLEAALWSVSRTATFRDAILLAANLREDADTTAAVTGQLAGAIYGQSGIPKEWQERLADRYTVVGAAIMGAY
jgi:ADP-ribosyl-[dinitrogen reductase] hydrolase